MAEGFVPDHGGAASTWVSVFVQGAPQAKTGFWEQMQKGAGVRNWEDEDVWAIQAFRCGDCGRLELFARERPDPSTSLKKPT